MTPLQSPEVFTALAFAYQGHGCTVRIGNYSSFNVTKSCSKRDRTQRLAVRLQTDSLSSWLAVRMHVLIGLRNKHYSVTYY